MRDTAFLFLFLSLLTLRLSRGDLMLNEQLRHMLQAMPKAELHLHIKDSIGADWIYLMTLLAKMLSYGTTSRGAGVR